MTPIIANARATILMVAGESSGDIHGAELIRSLLRSNPSLHFVGTGGPRMAAAGQEQSFDLTQHAVVGLVEVLKHYPVLLALFHRLINLAREKKPEAIILIDYPGFNLRLAKKLRGLLPQTRIIYYISPQVWAWKSGRAHEMARNLDLLLVIFEFEKEWFARHAPSLKVEWVGHPLLDRFVLQAKHEAPPDTAGTRCVALLPGSRMGEIRKHLPVLINTAKILHGAHSNIRFVWIAPDMDIYQKGMKILEEHRAHSLPLDTYSGYPLSHLSRCHLALLASGSVSLECAALNLPQIVFYLVHPLTYQIGRMVVKLKFLSMVNILAGKPIVPELVQHRLKPEDLARLALRLLKNKEERETMQVNLQKVVNQLGTLGASGRAAEQVLNFMAQRRVPAALS